ncbi:Na(+)/H(+)-K(+) antiporter GerN [Polaribacter huanghezhanensis]|uniref:cation:proton antiporter domain-containing protein n=1 Tax=Polaribacter huanghezhanensis TaxID=1354726 RepID=UPI002648B93C|nr:cation:proton antiporter [Polaribacter huanghezhanensis]WKD86773.1 Na(+)/H(+)-K(+) antiporter GerN [Polaribacter huanghezhanensis]
MPIKSVLIFLIGFIIVAIAANQVAKVFQKIKFPLITGLIITGIIAGSSVLNFIPTDAIDKLHFLNEIALAIIAFSAGSELYLNDLRSRIQSIKWMTIGQLIITFVASSITIYFVADSIPFMADLSAKSKVAIAILFGTIFVARSPSSAIAVINEMRANGPFTKTVMGVTVVKDVLVIILFAVCFSIAKAFINEEEIGFFFLVILSLELLASFIIGYLLGKLLQVPFVYKIPHSLKAFLIVAIGYGVYIFAYYVKLETSIYLHHEFVLEPLLICIIGSFTLTNYSKHRIEFSELLHEISPFIYIIFFTLTGASLSLQVLYSVFGIAFGLFFLRLITMFFGGLFGVYAAKDKKEYRFIAWMPYLTQAGVALGLATIVANEFPTWGHEFETIVIAIIVINQLIGPPLFKWALNFVKESHTKASLQKFDGTRDAVIFGVESQSLALANQLEKNKWETRIVGFDATDFHKETEYDYIHLEDISLQSILTLQLEKTEGIILMLSDEKNYQLAEIIYENIGTANVVVRLNKRENFDKFHKLGALIIEPATALVSLLDHFVRSPNATSLLLGMDEGQDSMDIEIRNQDIHGMRLRDLRLPSDVLVLSVKRKGQLLVSHGYTRLRLGDIMTLVGSETSLEELKFKFDT